MKAMGKLSASEKEKTKIRERNRRSITTKIFHGLRKYGGYNLAPRADINEVLRCLAAEAGWTVEEDGTTYRFQAPSGAQSLRQLSNGAGRASFSVGSVSGISGLIGSASCGGNLLGAGGGALLSCGVGGGILGGPMSAGTGLFSLQPMDVGGYLDARGGDCSTTASPRHQAPTNSGSFFSAHPTTATPTTTSSISFMPSASPFASPASSEVYPSSSRSTTTLAPPPLPTAATASAFYFASAFPSSVNYNSSYYLPSAVGDGGALPAVLKDDLLDALPLDLICSSEVQNHHPSLLTAAGMAARRQGHEQILLEQQQQELECPSPASIFGTARLSASRGGNIPPLLVISQQQVHPFLQEARASNHNTPLGSPQHHG